MRIAYLLFLCLSAFYSSAFSGPDTLFYRPQFDITVIGSNSDTLISPWCGGMNQPQFSAMDLNGDNVKDLVVFDRSGSVMQTFIAYQKPDKSWYYTYDPSYESRFPESDDILILADHNKDGREDCWYRDPFDGYLKLAHSTGNTFSKPESFLKAYNFGNPPFDSSNFVLWIGNHPAITDIDNDGDLDFFSTDYCGTDLIYYLNNTAENSLPSGNHSFEIPDRCFGDLGEDQLGLKLGAKCLYPNKYYRYNKKKHCSSKTLAFYDIDNDGDKDLFLGNSEGLDYTMLLIINGKKDFNRSIDTFIRIDSFYIDSMAVKNMAIAPSVYFIDLDKDGITDMLLSGNEGRKIDYPVKERDHIVFLKNYGTNALPDFRYQTHDFLIGEMIDMGGMSHPVLHDLDKDGDLDLLVASNGDHFKSADKNDRLAYYENIGNKTLPVFKLISEDFWNISKDSLVGISPAFGDLNGDGKPELLMGTTNGNLALYENKGTLQSPDFQIISKEAYGLQVAGSTAPCLADLNKDGLIDLLLGSREGNIYWYQNNGTSAQAAWEHKSDSFGKILINKLIQENPPIYSFLGYSAPTVADLNKDGKLDLLVGGHEGYFKVYMNIETNLNGTFELSDSLIILDNVLQRQDLGSRIKITTGDLNGDSIPEIISGNMRGGLHLYKGFLITEGGGGFISNRTHQILRIYPNPTKNQFVIQAGAGEINITTIDGKVLFHQTSSEIEHRIDGSNWPAGIYLAKWSDKFGNIATGKVVITK